MAKTWTQQTLTPGFAKPEPETTSSGGALQQNETANTELVSQVNFLVDRTQRLVWPPRLRGLLQWLLETAWMLVFLSLQRDHPSGAQSWCIFLVSLAIIVHLFPSGNCILSLKLLLFLPVVQKLHSQSPTWQKGQKCGQLQSGIEHQRFAILWLFL